MSDATDVLQAARQERFDQGMQVLNRILGERGHDFVDRLADVSPEFCHQIVAWLFGEMYPRPGLAPRDRQLVTLGVLAALGGTEPEVEVQTEASLNVGLTPEEIVEALLHSAAYCGIPRAVNATLAARRVFGERGLLPITEQRGQGPAETVSQSMGQPA